MKYLLSKSSSAILERLARQRTLCAFDFDGTLSSIVDHPDLAGLRTRTECLLQELAALYPCIVVSGRTRADVLAKLRGIPLARVIGNHGAETGVTRRSLAHIEQWKEILAAELALLPGLWIEDKGFSLAVHYRHSPRKPQTRRMILKAAEKLRHVRVVGGKLVVNLVEEHAPHKGDAVAAERLRLGCDWVLYVGDDDNDEDAFALDGNLVSVRVGKKQHTRAQYYLRAQSEIDALLEKLVLLRTSKSRCASAHKVRPGS